MTTDEFNDLTEKSDNQRPAASQPPKRSFFEPGTILADRYRVISVIGQGGMGVVYKAEHIHMEREMAIKTLAQEMAPESEPFRRFKQEAKIIAALKHPNIVDIHDFAIAGNQAYLVMDFLNGIHIEKAIDEFGPMGLDHFVHIFSQACEALYHAHNKGIIHRDLKGGNMMIVTEDDRRDILKLVDFGIAKLLADDVEEDLILTKAGKIVGSPLFMSPEQCLGHEFDHRVDIYSLGIVMYRSLTGELPLVGENAMKTLHKQITEMPPPFSEVNPDVYVPESLESVVRKALAKQPEERQQTMLELLQDLKEALRTAELSTASAQETEKDAQEAEEDQAFAPLLEPVAAVPMAAVQEQSDNPEPTSALSFAPGLGTTEKDMPAPLQGDDDWKALTSPGLTPVTLPGPRSTQVPSPQPPLPANPTLPAGVSSNAFAARWRASSGPLPIQAGTVREAVNSNQVFNAPQGAAGLAVPRPSGASPGSGSYQAYAGGGSRPAPPPRPKVNPALFKWGQFEAPPEGLPPIPPAQSFNRYSRGSGHGMPAQSTGSPAKDAGPGSMKQQLDQIVKRSAQQAKIDRIIEEQDKLAASKRDLKAYQPTSQSTSSSMHPAAKSSPGVIAGGAASGRRPTYKSAPLVDEFFLDKLVDKFSQPFRKLFASKEESYVQQVDDQATATVAPITYIGIVAAPIIVFFLAWHIWPRGETVDHAFGRLAHVYKSTDGQVQFRLADTSSCELRVGDKRNSTKCRFYLNDWRDAVELAATYPFQNQYWLYETAYGIADDTDNALYGAYSPESDLTKNIEEIAKYAAACYKQTGHYPDSATAVKVEDVDLDYKNPFTKDPEVPTFQSITVGSGEDEAADNKKRRKFFNRMLEGRSWKDAPEPKPGQIRCCAVTFKNKAGDSFGFVAQLIGLDSQPMRGFSSGTRYVYALENGKEYDGFSDIEAPKFPFTKSSGQPDVVWFFTERPSSDVVSFIKNGAMLFGGFLAVVILFLVLSSKKLMRRM